MMTQSIDARFWDKIARKYAADPIKNLPAYEATLERVQARLGREDRVLEIGCGTGSTALRLADGVAHYVGADVSPGMIEIAREKLAETWLTNLEFTVAPALETRFDAESFDKVLTFNLLHLLEDLDGALRRAYDLLKPGGVFISKTPCLSEMGLHVRLAVPLMRFFGKAPFVGFFTSHGLEQKIQAAGFEIEESRVFEGAKRVRYLVARKT